MNIKRLVSVGMIVATIEAQGNLSFMELLNGLIKNLELLSNP
ncbi:hypothetical protein [Cylindrospermopsis raciborskii]|nr:hypothetical protein [Cylindrospermopsis raciborskii]